MQKKALNFFLHLIYYVTTIFFVVFSSAEFPLTFVPLLGTMGAIILLWEVRPCGS